MKKKIDLNVYFDDYRSKQTKRKQMPNKRNKLKKNKFRVMMNHLRLFRFLKSRFEFCPKIHPNLISIKNITFVVL